MNDICIGIDLGTCYSSVGYDNSHGVEFIKDDSAPQLTYSIPSSALLRANNTYVFGELAESEKTATPEGYQREFKRDLGSSIPYRLRDKQVLAAELSAKFLTFLAELTTKTLPIAPAATVITVPAAYDQFRRSLIDDAARRAGLAEVSLAAEPVAAVISAVDRGEVADNTTILVYDLGGGTFDTAVVRLEGGRNQVLGASGLANFGGTDIDVFIQQDFAHKAGDEFAELVADQSTDDPKRRARAQRARIAARDLCRNIKHRLSSADLASDVLNLSIHYELSRSDLEDMVRPHLDHTVSTCQQLLASLALTPEQIDTVLLVGGTSRMPLVREVLAREFGRPVRRAADPELAVCIGATILARTGMKARDEAERKARQQAQRKARQEAQRKAQAEAERKAQAEAERKAEAEAKRKAEAEAKRKAAAEAERRKNNQLSAGTATTQTSAAESSPRPVHVLAGHKGMFISVTDVAFSPDGNLLASCATDKTVRLWDPATGTHLRTLTGHSSWNAGVQSVAFSTDGQLLASGGGDKVVRLWDPATGKHLRTLTGHTAYVNGVAFSPDGRLLASAGDKTVRLWDPATATHLRTLTGHTDWVRGVAFSPDGQLLASGSDDKTVRLWDLATGENRRILTGHTGWVRGVAFSPDGRLLASGGDKTVRLWDPATGTHLRTQTGHTSAVRAVAFSPDGRLLASAGDKTVRLWDPATGTHLRALTGHTDYVLGVAFSPDGRLLASGSADKNVRLWDPARQVLDPAAADPDGLVTSARAELAARKQTERLDADYARALLLIGARDWRRAIEVLERIAQVNPTYRSTPALLEQARRQLADTAPAQGRQPASGTNESKMSEAGDVPRLAHTLAGHTESVYAVAFSPDGRLLASCGKDKTVRLWEVATGEHRRTLTGHNGLVWAVAFSPDGQLLASCGKDKTVQLWDPATGEQRQALTGHTARASGVAFSPDGRLLASCGNDRTVQLWDPATGHRKRVLTGHTSDVTGVAFSPDGRLLASCGNDKTARLWEVATGEHRRTLTGPTSLVHGVAFSPDGRLLATAHQDDKVRVWNPATGEHRHTLTGHTNTVHGVAFSTDGRLLASCSADKTVRLWDPATGEHRHTLTGHEGGLFAFLHGVAFSPDGRFLASCGNDKTARLWDLTSASGS